MERQDSSGCFFTSQWNKGTDADYTPPSQPDQKEEPTLLLVLALLDYAKAQTPRTATHTSAAAPALPARAEVRPSWVLREQRPWIWVFFQTDIFTVICALVHTAVQFPRVHLCPDQILPTEKVCGYFQIFLHNLDWVSQVMIFPGVLCKCTV